MSVADWTCSIGDSDTDIGRMLEVLRFWFTKDLVRVLPTCTLNARADEAVEIRQGEAVQAL